MRTFGDDTHTISGAELQALCAVVGLYLKSLDDDPANEYLNFAEAYLVTTLRDFLTRFEALA